MPQIPKQLLGKSAQHVWQEQNRQQIAAQRIVASPDIEPRKSLDGTGLFLVKRISRGGGASVTKLILKDFEAGDYLLCRAWNEYYWKARRDLRTELGTAPTEGQLLTRINTLRAAASLAAWTSQNLTDYLAAETPVAKPPELRADAMDSKEIDIVVESWNGSVLSASTVKLSFDYHSATLRTVTDEDSSATERQTIIPRYVVEESIIHAISSDQVEAVADASDVRLMDMNLAGRAWCRTTA